MKKANYLVPLIMLIACSEEVALPEPEKESEQEERIFQTDPVCYFDLSVEVEDEVLMREWEFVGYQDLETNKIDHWTCNARWAHASYYQGGYETNPEDYDFPLFLNLRQFEYTGESNPCQGQLQLETITHAVHIVSCYTLTGESGIQFNVGQEFFETETSITTLPEIDHHQRYLEALENTTDYKIESNRLYLFYGKDNYRMVFVALEEKESEN